MAPKIATHITQEVYRTTKAMIESESKEMTEDEITQRCTDLMAEADRLSSQMIHDKKMQSSRDVMYARWIAELSEMATIWSMV